MTHLVGHVLPQSVGLVLWSAKRGTVSAPLASSSGFVLHAGKAGGLAARGRQSVGSLVSSRRADDLLLRRRFGVDLRQALGLSRERVLLGLDFIVVRKVLDVLWRS